MEVRIHRKQLPQLIRRLRPPRLRRQQRQEMFPRLLAKRATNNAHRQVEPSIRIRAPALGVLVRERQRVVDRGDVDVRLTRVRLAVRRADPQRVRRRRARAHLRRGRGRSGLGPPQFGHLRHLDVARGRDVNERLAHFAVAVLDHVVVRPAVGVEHQVVYASGQSSV